MSEQTPSETPAAAQEPKMSFKQFAAAHLTGTVNQVYTLLLQRQHGTEKHTLTEWKTVLESYASRVAKR